MSNDYHGRIMNLQIDPENVLDGWTRREFGAYKDGHRDARHNAAVIGNDADIELHAARARIAELEAECARLRGAMPVPGWIASAADIVERAAETPDERALAGWLRDSAQRIAALATPDAGAATGAGTGGAPRWPEDYEACPNCRRSFSFSGPVNGGGCPDCRYRPPAK